MIFSYRAAFICFNKIIRLFGWQWAHKHFSFDHFLFQMNKNILEYKNYTQ